jgi:hypothetical protein
MNITPLNKLIFIPFLLLNSLNVLSQKNKQSKDYALFFAVNEYDNLRNLNNPISNARGIANILKKDYGFETEIVENPSLTMITDKLREYYTQFQNGEKDRNGQLLLFFSGHGMVEFENGYFLAKDTDPKSLFNSGINYEIWRPFIDQIRCKHILVAIDACYSVRFDRNWKNRANPFFQRPGELNETERMLSDHEKNKARFLFTSDGNEEETPDKSGFAKKFQEALISGGGFDGILTSTEVFTYLERARPKPHGNQFGDDEPGSSFLFVKRQENPVNTFRS